MDLMERICIKFRSSNSANLRQSSSPILTGRASSAASFKSKMTSTDTHHDPNMISWADYMAQNAPDEDESSSISDEDFRDDSLNDADWTDQQGGASP